MKYCNKCQSIKCVHRANTEKTASSAVHLPSISSRNDVEINSNLSGKWYSCQPQTLRVKLEVGC